MDLENELLSTYKQKDTVLMLQFVVIKLRTQIGDTMKLQVVRTQFGKDATNGLLFIDGVFECYTLEIVPKQ